MFAKKILPGGVVLVTMAALLLAKVNQEPESGAAMIEAAQAFLNSLTPEQRDRALFAYDDEKERLNWHFIPRQRNGLPLKDLEGDALAAAHRFIASGLSEAGYSQALDVMSLEEVLYLFEGGDRGQRREKRDPRKYYLSVFGTPDANGTWGWRVEGHHISLNYTVSDGQVVATTPEFFGANPGLVDAGPGRSLRVLGTEEDLARQILKLCTPEQQEVTWIEKEAPDDLRGGGARQPETTPPAGLPAAKMSDDQKELLAQLLTEYLKNMPADIERERRKRIEADGIDGIHFAWWGSPDRNERHYYRVQGPSFIIEYNNTQNSANHVHSMWRDMAGDFNISLK